MKELPERRLLVRAGVTLLTLDLGQIREVRGAESAGLALLAQLLELPVVAPGLVELVMETSRRPVSVAVDGVGGVVEIARSDVLKMSSNVLLHRPGLVRAVMRVPEPAAWRGSSMLPTPIAEVMVASLSANRRVLAADLDPVELGSLLLERVPEAAA